MTSSAVDAESLKKRLQFALILNALIVAAEVTVGLRVDSVGLLSDAGHNTIDQGALFLTLYSHLLSLKPATGRRTFGYHRAGIVTAFLNSFVLLVTAAGLSIMAAWRLLHPVAVEGRWMAGAAFFSFLANLGIAMLLERDAGHDLNIKAAFWHMLGDAWVSFGVVFSGAAILLTGWNVLDPLISLVIVTVIVKGALTVFRESLSVLMESAPAEVSPDEVVQELRGVPGVVNAHDLHLWSIKPGMTMLSCHVAMDGASDELRESVLQEINRRLALRFKIDHAAIQIERTCAQSGRLHCDLEEGAIH